MELEIGGEGEYSVCSWKESEMSSKLDEDNYISIKQDNRRNTSSASDVSNPNLDPTPKLDKTRKSKNHPGKRKGKVCM